MNITPGTSRTIKVGKRGVQLKAFEVVLEELLRNSSSSSSPSSSSLAGGTRPNFVKLPPLSAVPGWSNGIVVSGKEHEGAYQGSIDSSPTDPVSRKSSTKQGRRGTGGDLDDDKEENEAEWPWNVLPPGARVWGKGRGQIANEARARRKEGQVSSLLRCILPMILPLHDADAESGEDAEGNEQKKMPHDHSVGGIETANQVGDDSIAGSVVGTGKQSTRKKITIVDFCGGSGHLAVPLALLLLRLQKAAAEANGGRTCVEYEVVVVDLSAASLDFVHQRADQFTNASSSSSLGGDSHTENDRSASSARVYNVRMRGERGGNANHKVDLTKHDHVKRRCRGIPNLYTYHGSIETFDGRQPFDIGVALHGCGEASDIVLRSCGRAGANFVLAPCCVGKLNRNAHNPYIYHATSENHHTISYPQSLAYQRLFDHGRQSEAWDVLAKAADYSDSGQVRSSRNATRRTAKAYLEHDRLMFARETYGYDTRLTRMVPWESSPKNDILLGWFDAAATHAARNGRCALVGSPFRHVAREMTQSCGQCNADIELSADHLLSDPSSAVPPTDISSTDGSTANIGDYGPSDDSDLNRGCDSVDWTWQEEEDVRRQLERFVLNDSEGKLTFPTGMGSRRRKLVHYVAGQMDLAHWCVGKKNREKTVCVAKGGAKPATKANPVVCGKEREDENILIQADTGNTNKTTG